MVTGEPGGDEAKKSDEHDDPAPAAAQQDATAEETLQEPIRVKRTPRLRSGKHEQPDSTD